MNRNKRGVTIDLTRPEGIRLAKALVQQADATVDNYSVNVLPKFGLGPDALHTLKPGLVTLSMSAFGASSPWRECRAYGSTLEQGSGLPRLVGEENDLPVMGHPAFGDPVGGLNGAAALLSALLHARRTGQGQHIDLSQIECMMQMTAPWLIACSANHQSPQRYGMRHPDHAPHGNYRCAGDDAWDRACGHERMRNGSRCAASLGAMISHAMQRLLMLKAAGFVRMRLMPLWLCGVARGTLMPSWPNCSTLALQRA